MTEKAADFLRMDVGRIFKREYERIDWEGSIGVGRENSLG
jgi:hypothetical protein